MDFVVESQLNSADWAAFQKLFGDRLRARLGVWYRLATVLVPLALGALLFLRPFDQADSTPFLAFSLAVMATVVSMHVSARRLLRLALPDEDGLFLGSVRLELSTDGIRVLRANTSALTHWRGLKEITVTGAHVFLWTDRLSSYVVPRRDLPGGDPQPLLDALRQFAGDVKTTTARDAAPPAAARADDAAPKFFALLARRLTWRAVPAEGHGSSDAMIAACAAVTLALWLGYDRYAAGPNANWYLGGLASLAWYAAGALALAWVLHRASARAVGFNELLAAVVASLPLLLALGVAVRVFAPEPVRWAGYAILAFLALLQAARSLGGAAGTRVPGPLLAGAIFTALFWHVTEAAWVHPHLWYASHEERRRTSLADDERLLFAQADRIDAAASRMAAGRAHRPDVFFVGFAGVSDQKVFAEELKLGERVVTERYDAAGRSLLLVNDDRDHDRHPIASVEGLRRALARVAARMDRDEDVLFLLLTSHGSNEPSLSVSNGDLPLQDLDGKTLRAALDESGIRWRVVVISACHAGAFIEPLAEPGTIVLTAAAKERTSFGCDDKAELTYFGQALLRDALPDASSLESAFERATQLVSEREKREGLQPSEPQAYYGSAIREYWKQLEPVRR